MCDQAHKAHGVGAPPAGHELRGGMSNTVGPPSRALYVATGVIFGLTLAVFAVLKLYGWHLAQGDENIYYYMARLVAREGALPYRDFFFAHPPLHLLPLALIAKLAPHSILALKLMPMLSGVACGVLVFIIAWRSWGPLEAAFATALFLLCYEVLNTSNYSSGATTTSALTLAGVYYALRERPMASGVLLALAMLTGLYAAPAVVAVALILALGRRRVLLRLGIAFLAVWALLNLAFVLIAGPSYLQQVYLYGLRMPAGRVGKPFASLLVFWLMTNPMLVWSAVGGAAIRLIQPTKPAQPDRGKKRGRAAPRRVPYGQWLWKSADRRLWATMGAIGVLQLLFLSRLGNPMHYYAVLLFPFIALAGGYGWATWLRTAAGWFRPAIRQERGWIPAAVTVLIAGLATGAIGVFAHTSLPRSTVGQRALGRSEIRYQWADAPAPRWLNTAVKRYIWTDRYRPGHSYCGWQVYLWSESQRFPAARTLARLVREHTKPSETICGDMQVAPLVAMLSGRRLAANMVDTSSMRFYSGLLDVGSFWRQVLRDRLRLVIMEEPGDLYSVPDFGDRLHQECELRGTIEVSPGHSFQIYEVRSNR